jgi:dihydroorotase
LDQDSRLATTLHEAKTFCDQLIPGFKVHFSASATREMKGSEATDILSLAKDGAVCITDDGWGTQDDQVTRKIFEQCEKAGLPFFQHCESGLHHGVASPSEFQRKNGLKEYPRESESLMLKRDLSLLKDFPRLRYHALHLSTRESIEAIKRAKDQGLSVTCEVSPHHLFYSNEDIPDLQSVYSVNYKMNPPLFSAKDRSSLRAAFADGTIDFISTDHAPHAALQKQKGWAAAPFGTRGLETCFSVLWTLAEELGLRDGRVLEAFSSGPRSFLNQPIVDSSHFFFFEPTALWNVEENDLPGVSKNSCFIGAQLKGRIQYVVLGPDLYKV